MILKKEILTPDTVAAYFPQLLSDEPGTQYFIEVCALKIPQRKTVLNLHMQAAREHETVYPDGTTMVMRELYSPIGCVRAVLDKPMRQAQRELIYSEAREKLLARARNLIPDESHPYIRTLVTM